MAKIDQSAADYLAEQLQSGNPQSYQQQVNQVMVVWLPATDQGPIVWDVKARQDQAIARCQTMGMLTMAIPTSPSPPEIVTVRSKANEPTLASLLPRLTPAQREAAITLATRCGKPDRCAFGGGQAPPGDLRVYWNKTFVMVHPDGTVEGCTEVDHSSIDEVEAAVRGHVDITADLRPIWSKSQ